MPIIAEAISSHPSSMLYAATGAIALAASVAKGVSKSITRVPPNSAGIWEHHGRPYANKDSRLRRLAQYSMDKGVQKGDLFNDVEPGTYGHLPGARSIRHIGTHVRITNLEESPVDNEQTHRQHNVGATVFWQVVEKYDRNGELEQYTRRGQPVKYNELLRDAIYKARELHPDAKTSSPEDALKMVVVNKSAAFLREVMQEDDSSHKMTSAEALPKLVSKAKEDLLDYGIRIVDVAVNDTHFTDLMPEAVRNLLSMPGTEGEHLAPDTPIPLQMGDRRLWLVQNPPPGA
jgi:hypothetical protein